MINAEPEYLNKGLDNFGKITVLVMGDIMLDRFIWGEVSRISPEAPVPVVNVKRETTMLGGAANVVNNIASLGGNVILCGAIGEDPWGKEILAKLKELGIDTGGVISEPGRPTSVKTRIIAHAQQVVRYDREQRTCLGTETIDHILQHVDGKKADISGIIISDYGKGVVCPPLFEAINSLASRRRIPLAVDPNVKNFSLYKGVTIITPNNKQAGEVGGMEIVDEESLKIVGKKILEEYKCQNLLITRGEEGMSLFEGMRVPAHIKSVARRVYDVTGAGDTVIATLMMGLCVGLNLKSAAYLSNLAAGLVVGEVGTSTVRIEEIKELVRSHGNTHQ